MPCAIGSNTSICDVANASLIKSYRIAKETVIAKGFQWEIEWQAQRCFDNIDECEFLQEVAWVILCSGFRESVARKLFPSLREAFLGLQLASEIHANRKQCRRAALRVFKHVGKVNAILDIAAVVERMGYARVREIIRRDGVRFLQTLPYIGPITSYHLAKNFGLPVVKPDRHLQRITAAAGFRSPQEFCEMIANHVGDPVQVVDVVLWRYATLMPDYVKLFTIKEKPV